VKNEKLNSRFRKNTISYIILTLLDPQNCIPTLQTDRKSEGPHAGSVALVDMKQRRGDTDPRVCGTCLHPFELFPPRRCEKKDVLFCFFSESCPTTLFKEWLCQVENSHCPHQRHS